jgi:hypothetical protein
MNKLQKSIATTAATAAMLLQVSSGVLAATDLVISGNGSDSDSTINISQVNQNNVVQDNNTKVDNTIKINADTGNNQITDNTGGLIHLETGDVDVKSYIKNELNSNSAYVDNCGGCLDDASVVISGNGTESDNAVNLQLANQTALFQTNSADVDNKVKVDAWSGSNKVEDNTGADIVVLTGDVNVKTKTKTIANSNYAIIGGGEGDGGSVDIMLSGNGSYSVNKANLALANQTLLTQLNQTKIDNDTKINAGSGDNDVKDNTGGELAIVTGDVDVYADILNYAGFNYFAGDDCCYGDVWAKIGENGTDTENEINAQLVSALDVFQNNVCGHKHAQPGGFELLRGGRWHGDECFDNNLMVDAYTGGNDLDDNTGDADSDPFVYTGDADVKASVVNEGGSNTYGALENDPWEDMFDGSSLDVSISLDLGQLLDYLLGLA